MTIEQVIADFIKLLISGVIGGSVGSLISLKLFQAQKRVETKHQDQLLKREVLRDILVILPIVFRDIHLNWEMPKDSKETSSEHISVLIENIIRWRSLFLDDPDMLDALQKIDLLIGASPDQFFRKDDLNIKMPSEIIQEVRDVISLKIIALNKALTKI